MEFISKYIFGILAAAFFCSIVNSINISKGSNRVVIKMLCGIFMAISLIYPILKIEFDDITQYMDQISFDAQEEVESGLQMTYDSRSAIIKEKAESYILDKATCLGLNLMVEVTLTGTDPPIPESVVLKGNASPYAKKQLSGCIAEELGISEEQQKWI